MHLQTHKTHPYTPYAFIQAQKYTHRILSHTHTKTYITTCQTNSENSAKHFISFYSLPLYRSLFLHLFFLSFSLSLFLYLSTFLPPSLSYTHTVSLPFFWKPCASASMKCVQKAKCSEKGIAQRSSRSAISNTESLWWARGLPLPLLCRKQIVLLWCSIPTFAFQSG